MILIQITFPFDFLPAYPVGLIPVYFGSAYSSIGKTNRRDSFEFAPTTSTVLLSESPDLSDGTTDSDDLDFRDVGNDLK
jgi:hypothetical protein